jgi:hypothetical protein
VRQGKVPDVGEFDLRCSACNEWKPDDHFTTQTAAERQRRRFRSSECKECAKARRRFSRRRIAIERTYGPDVVICSRSFCLNPATRTLSFGTYAREIPLSPAGRKALDVENAAPLCDECHAYAAHTSLVTPPPSRVAYPGGES